MFKHPHNDSRTAIVLVLLGVLLSVGRSGSADAAQMSMGFRVGEVTQHSAIVWTRITKDAERNWTGVRERIKRVPKKDRYVPSPIAVADRQGEATGQAGQVRVHFWSAQDRSDTKSTGWVTVREENDYVHQFHLEGLEPATRYHLRVEARDAADAPVDATATGSFGTPAGAQSWQDVRFGVVTGQSYWDLDHKDGYHIYPAMQKLDLDFLIPTGDTVYLDSESPRARTVALARYHWHRMYSLPRHVELHRRVPGY